MYNEEQNSVKDVINPQGNTTVRSSHVKKHVTLGTDHVWWGRDWSKGCGTDSCPGSCRTLSAIPHLSSVF